jgi:hypothetical protein
MRNDAYSLLDEKMGILSLTRQGVSGMVWGRHWAVQVFARVLWVWRFQCRIYF